MVLFTSLSPRHHNKDRQQNCLDSWNKVGVECFSVNAKKEIPEVNYKGVTVLENNDFYFRNNRCYTKLNSIFKDALDRVSDYLILTNSDIECVYSKDELTSLCEKTKDGVLCLNRWEFTDDKSDCIIDRKGFDTFIIPKSIIQLYVESPFVLGLTHFDFWIPYRAQKNNIPIYRTNEKVILHKRHKLHYDSKEWQITGKWISDLEGLIRFNYNTRKISDYVYSEIQKKFITI